MIYAILTYVLNTFQLSYKGVQVLEIREQLTHSVEAVVKAVEKCHYLSDSVQWFCDTLDMVRRSDTWKILPVSSEDEDESEDESTDGRVNVIMWDPTVHDWDQRHRCQNIHCCFARQREL